jgi:hypothetical protein
VLDDRAYSYLFETCTGFPLGEKALSAREERHKAVNIMPFKDRAQDQQQKK